MGNKTIRVDATVSGNPSPAQALEWQSRGNFRSVADDENSMFDIFRLPGNGLDILKVKPSLGRQHCVVPIVLNVYMNRSASKPYIIMIYETEKLRMLKVNISSNGKRKHLPNVSRRIRRDYTWHT
ncbi:MAG: hypothetical protein HRU40_18605 [Saprospiraceae bacterium]|nr:hypothetical protein [Saprospiraceae bacterium]